MRAPSYKPLLFTTTVRNPERLKDFLSVLKAYDARTLDDALAVEISGELIRNGLYKPQVLSKRVRRKIRDKSPLTDAEVAKVLRDNPQDHKEAGFSKGWPSRFDTWFKLAKELGFVFYKSGAKIRFSEVGLNLASGKYAEFEQQAFLNAFVKYQSNNPFRRVLNENVPLILLLQVIGRLNADDEFNGAGISKLELPLVLYWKNDDAAALYQRIKAIRREFGYSPSWEVIVEICRNEIMLGKDIARKSKSIMVDYPDDFIRKMRLTGLISLRGGGRFIDINNNEQDKVSYILGNYVDYEKYATEESYFDYISSVDEMLISFQPKEITLDRREELLVKWLDVYPWGKIKAEMLALSRKRLSKDEMLKYLTGPVRLEFLTALSVKSRFPEVRVIPNYPIDDEGIPTSTAGGHGDTGDIECFENSNGILIEVTMSEGRTQTVMEVWPIARHLEAFSTKAANSVCYFVAPSIFVDSMRQIKYVKNEDGLLIFPSTIGDFLSHLESAAALYKEG